MHLEGQSPSPSKSPAAARKWVQTLMHMHLSNEDVAQISMKMNIHDRKKVACIKHVYKLAQCQVVFEQQQLLQKQK